MKKRFWPLLVLGLLLAPFLFLHGVVLLFALNEKPLAETEKKVFTQPDGAPLVTFWHQTPSARTTLIFVHGTPANGAAFREQMKGTFPETDLVTYDRPGFGASPGAEDQARLAYQAQTLLRIIAQVTTPSIVLVGHSYGGPVVLLAAALAPERITGVVTIGGCFSPAEEHAWFLQYGGNFFLIRWLLPAPLRSCNEELLTLKDDLKMLDGRLPAVRCPVLLLQGTADEQVPAANVPYLEKHFSQLGKSRLLTSHLFPGYNHFMMWEHPTVVNEEIRHFLPPPPPK